MADTVNKVKFGLSNVFYFKATLGTGNVITYGTPVAIPGAVNIALKPVGEPIAVPADNITDYFLFNDNQGYEGDLEIEILPDSFKTDILGETLDLDGVIIENATATLGKFALSFQVEGDLKARRSVYYYCSAQRLPVESSTKAEKNEVKTDKLSIKMKPRPDTGDVKASTTEAVQPAVYAAWNTTVWEKDGAGA